MKIIFSIWAAFLLMPFLSHAQLTGSGPKVSNTTPVHWMFSVKKIEGGNYRIEAKATMDPGYHIWAQDAGGDGTLIPTSFTTEQLQNGSWLGDWKEMEQPKTSKVTEIEGAIRYHEKAVTFYRDFKGGAKGQKVKGAVQYQSCNDQMCFPPAIENFIVSVN